MASVFLSYDHQDAARAGPIASALEKAGHSVWWDQRIFGGAEYNREIQSAVERSDAVVVLWSERSVDSAWVRDEAAEGRDRGKLVPVLIDPVKPPMGFRQHQTIDLSKARGARPSHGMTRLLQALENISAPAQANASAVISMPPRLRRFSGLTVGILVATVLVVAALATWRLLPGSSGVPIVKVVAADSSPASQGLARDLLVKLGSLQSAKTGEMRLIGAEQAQDDADLIIEASSSTLAPQTNVSVLAGNNRALLWSKDFPQGAGGQAIGEEQMAYTTANVLSCGLEADKRGSVRLDQQTLKLFLSGCARFAEGYHIEPAAVVPIFSQVVGAAPQFQPAWRKLLLADTLVTRNGRMFQDRFSPERLPQDIVAARKLNPRIPEIYVAETELQPLNAYAKRLELLDHAVQLDPDNPDALISRAVHLDAVGRIDEEFNDANRAVEIDPLSPGLRAILIASLINAGKVSAAEEQLRQADALWPGAQTIDDSRLRLNTRYGDAKAALNALKSDTNRRQNYSPSLEAFLTARIDPTPSNIQRAINSASEPHLTDSKALAQLMQMLGQFHRENELYDVLLHWRRTDVLGSVSQVYFRATLHKFRQDPRFMIVAYRAGLVSYWRKSGKWPDFCSEPDLPYNCKAEAAKFAA